MRKHACYCYSSPHDLTSMDLPCPASHRVNSLESQSTVGVSNHSLDRSIYSEDLVYHDLMRLQGISWDVMVRYIVNTSSTSQGGGGS